jgi:hypothetical protein
VREGKPVVVYIAPENSFYTLRQSRELAEMLERFDPTALARIDRELQAVASANGSSRKVDSMPLF